MEKIGHGFLDTKRDEKISVQENPKNRSKNDSKMSTYHSQIEQVHKKSPTSFVLSGVGGRRYGASRNGRDRISFADGSDTYNYRLDREIANISAFDKPQRSTIESVMSSEATRLQTDALEQLVDRGAIESYLTKRLHHNRNAQPSFGYPLKLNQSIDVPGGATKDFIGTGRPFSPDTQLDSLNIGMDFVPLTAKNNAGKGLNE